MLDASISYYFGETTISKLLACTIYITAWKTIVQLVHLLSDGLTHHLWSDGGWVDSFADLGWVFSYFGGTAGYRLAQNGLGQDNWILLHMVHVVASHPPIGQPRIVHSVVIGFHKNVQGFLRPRLRTGPSLLPHSVIQNKSNYKAKLVSRGREELQSQGSIREAEE